MVWLSITFSMAGKFFNSASFDIVYIYSAEIFPTVVRNVGVGSSSTWARIGALVAPFIKQVVRYQSSSFFFPVKSVTNCEV